MKQTKKKESEYSAFEAALRKIVKVPPAVIKSRIAQEKKQCDADRASTVENQIHACSTLPVTSS